jgi:hypothetical protein
MCIPLLVGAAATASTAATAGLIGSGGAVSSGFLSALTVASTAGSLVAQQNAAKAQTDANRRQYENTLTARAANLNQTNLMQQQERESGSQQLEQNNMAARAARSTATVSSGESGISGLSVDALMADLGTKQNRFNSSVVTNYDNSSMAIANQRQNIDLNAASQINSLKTPDRPDYLGAALRIGNASAKAGWLGESAKKYVS